MEGCDAVEREVDRFTNRVKNVQNIFSTEVEKLCQHIEELKKEYGEVVDENYALSTDQSTIVFETLNRVRDLVGRLATDHRDLHSAVSKVGKAIDRNFNADFGTITRDGIFSGERAQILTQVVCQHLYREGLLDIGEALCQESCLSLEPKYKEPFVELHRILDSLAARELEPALKWAHDNHQALNAQGSSLEFKLHRLAFIDLIKKGKSHQAEAIHYARENFCQFVTKHEKEIQVLMGSLLYIPGKIEMSPYKYLFDSSLWDDIHETFLKDACARLGLSVDSPLAVCFQAGCIALPALLNICQVMQARQVTNIWSGKDELPIEIDLGKEFHYHSIFACPILRQQASETNPPMRLVCGHVISRDALHKLSSGNKMKCPYCPGEQNPAEARQITF